MKQLISITAIFLMFLVGCSEEVNINNPIENPVTSEAFALTNEELVAQKPIEDIQMDTLLISVVKEIDGTLGGAFSIDQDVVSSDGRVSHVKVQFQVSPGAFSNTQTISMTADINNGCITFYPHMNFDKKCKLDYVLENINLATLGFTKHNNKASFVYFDDSGVIYPIENDGVTLDFDKGTLKVNSAELKHFSRFGFIRRD